MFSFKYLIYKQYKKINHIQKDIITHDLIDESKKQIEQCQTFLTYNTLILRQVIYLIF